MKLKLISDGTSVGTKIIDEETGEMLHGISNLTFEVSAHEPLTKLTLELFSVPVEFSATAKIDVKKINKNSEWEHSETISKDISVSSIKEGSLVKTSSTQIVDVNSKELISGVESIRLSANPQTVSVTVSKLNI